MTCREEAVLRSSESHCSYIFIESFVSVHISIKLSVESYSSFIVLFEFCILYASAILDQLSFYFVL